MPFPNFIEKSKDGDKAYDVYSRMLKDRIVFLTGTVEEDMANHLVAQLLLLESQNDKAPINMYINSPGGSVMQGLAIYDTMQYIKSPIHTIVIGQAASMGSLLAQAGDKRYITQSSRHMIHRVSSGTGGTSGSVHIQELEFEDARRHLEESKKLNSMLTQIYAKHNTAGKTFEELFEVMKFDTFLSAEESVAYGLADEVVAKV
jgi:ATP-dependent Clp protease protease subunit